jgi:hypothetical protein
VAYRAELWPYRAPPAPPFGSCLFSDYSPAGHGLTGIRCHRGAKQLYLAVRSKPDYWHVPLTEAVPETYVCNEYQRRIPGTGYRG